MNRPLILFILLCAVVVISSGAPDYQEIKNVPTGESLNGLFYINDNADNYGAWNCGNNLCFENTVEHKTGVTLKIKANALYARNGNANYIQVQHVADNGEITKTVVSLGVPDQQGYVYIVVDFSTVIIGGVTSTVTKTFYNVSSGDDLNICPEGCNVTKAIINITNSANKTTLLTLSSNQTHGTHQVFLNTTFSSSCGQTNMSDVKYYSADGTLIPYWNQSTITSQYANWWLNVSSINNGSTYFYRECGETGLSSVGSIFATGLNGSDDFSTDLSNWTLTQSTAGNVQIVSGEARIKGSGTWNANGMTSNANFARPVVLEWQSRTSALIHGYEGYGVQPINTESGLYFRREGSVATLYRALDGGLLEVGTKSTASTTQKIILPSIGYTIYWNEIEEETDASWATDNNKLAFQTYTNGQYMYVPWVFARNGTTANITWLDEGAELNISSNFTAGEYTSSNHNITNGVYSETFTTQNIQNVTLQWNGYGTSTVIVTIEILDNYTQIDEIHENNYHNISLNYTSPLNQTNLSFTVNHTNYSDFLIGNITASNGSVNCTGLNCTLNVSSYTAGNIFSSVVSHQYFNTSTISSPAQNTTSINISSTTFTGIDTYFTEHSVNGSGIWNYTNSTSPNIQITNLTTAAVYDIRQRVNRTSDGVMSGYSNVLTIQVLTGDEDLNAVLAQIELHQAELLQQLNETQVQNAALQAQNETILAATRALWGSGLLGGIIVIGWLKKSMKV